MHQARRDDGFTLVELLVVVVILGVLAGLVVIAVGNLGGDANEAGCKSQRDQIEKAIQGYLAQNPGTTQAAFNDFSALTAGPKPRLRYDPQDRFTITGGVLTGVGKCEDF